jgi:hypothetical protein
MLHIFALSGMKDNLTRVAQKEEKRNGGLNARFQLLIGFQRYLGDGRKSKIWLTMMHELSYIRRREDFPLPEMETKTTRGKYALR